MSHDETDIGKIDTTDEMQQMAKPVVSYNIIMNPSSPSELGNYVAGKIAANPCVYLDHRPAHRVDGGIECYDCGARYA